MTRLRVFETNQCEGIESTLFCDGVMHFDRFRDQYVFGKDDRSGISVRGACDGSCKPEPRTKDLRKLLEDAQYERMENEEGEILPCSIQLDAAATELFASDQPLLGVEFASMYAKRNSRSNDYCLGSVHLYWSEAFDWHLEANPKTHATHRLTVTPCDKSCVKTTKLSGSERRRLRKQQRHHIIWQDEWDAKHRKDERPASIVVSYNDDTAERTEWIR